MKYFACRNARDLELALEILTSRFTGTEEAVLFDFQKCTDESARAILSSVEVLPVTREKLAPLKRMAIMFPPSATEETFTAARLRFPEIIRAVVPVPAFENPKDYQSRWLGRTRSDGLRSFFDRAHALTQVLARNGYVFIPGLPLDPPGLWTTEYLTALVRSSVPAVVLSAASAPSKEWLEILRQTFSNLSLLPDLPYKPVLFYPDTPGFEDWNLLSLNPFAGPREAHIDISNTCTHSCEFCGLYSNQGQAPFQKPDGTGLNDEVKAFMRLKLPREKFDPLMADLSDNLQRVQFGGAGDPLVHPDAYYFLSRVRNRGLKVEILSNFEYPTEENLRTLCELAGDEPDALHIIANVSAGTEATYLKTRPRQTAKTWEKVRRNLKRLSELKAETGAYGLKLTLMCVTYQGNVGDAKAYVDMARELGWGLIWFKPLEVHAPYQYGLLPTKEQQADYAAALYEALQYARSVGIAVYDAHVIEALHKSSRPKISKWKFNPARVKNLVQIGVQDAGGSQKLYQGMACRVGYEYARFEVNGDVKGCCSAKNPAGSLNKSAFGEIWTSKSYGLFREKMSRIHIEKFHLKDPEWAFCQQCPHQGMNTNFRNKEKAVLGV